MKQKQILIIGGGYGGIQTALSLSEKKLSDTKITLINNKSHFEYTSRLYRAVTGKSPLQVCVPIRDFIGDKNIDFIVDQIQGFDFRKNVAIGKNKKQYSFDYLVLAVGAETTYFGIPGIEEHSFGFKTIKEALELKRHIHDMFLQASKQDAWDQVDEVNVVVVGAGASGVEIASELALYTQMLSEKHGVDYSSVSIELIEAANRVLPAMPEQISAKVEKRLENLGVKVYTNRKVTKSTAEKIFLQDMEMQTKTVVWTAGVTTSSLLKEVAGIKLDKKGRVEVDKNMQIAGKQNIFAIGDIAQDKYWGMAQTALHHAKYVANYIANDINNRKTADFKPKPVAYAVPVGTGWAAVLFSGMRFYGRIGWWIRKLADLRFFLSTLPFKKAILAYRQESVLCETCEDCLTVNN